MINKTMNKVWNTVRIKLGKKRLGGSKAILVEVILLLLAVAAVLLYKTNLVDMVQDIIANCKAQLTSIIG